MQKNWFKKIKRGIYCKNFLTIWLHIVCGRNLHNNLKTTTKDFTTILCFMVPIINRTISCLWLKITEFMKQSINYKVGLLAPFIRLIMALVINNNYKPNFNQHMIKKNLNKQHKLHCYICSKLSRATKQDRKSQ